VPGTFEVWSTVSSHAVKRSRSLKHLAIQASVLVALVAGVAAFVSFDKAVALSVDGETRTVHTFANTVGGLLEGEGIKVGEHDTVVPAPATRVEEGQRVAVRFGRQLTLTMDGSVRRVWVTATNVDEALRQLGLRADGLYLSASRSARIGREGLALVLRTPRDVTVIADGKKRSLTTTAATIRDVLAAAGVGLRAKDEVNPALSEYPAEGAVIRVVRVDAKRVTVKVDIPYDVKRVADKSLNKGDDKVDVEGVKGVKQITYALVTRDGKTARKAVVSEKVLRKPKTEVVRYGTKVVPKPFGGGSTGVENLNWAALAECESGGNPRAYNPAGPYYGLYQFSAPTWRSVGGSGLPYDASPAEQTYRAQVLYKKAGAGQWPVCGRRLFS
jgi:resuscitation-promoting factor RpfB